MAERKDVVKASTEQPEEGEAVRTPTVGKNRSKGTPFDLKAAFAAKLAADGDTVTLDVYDYEATAQSMALWTEDQLNELQVSTPTQTLELIFGADGAEKVRKAIEDGEGKMTLLHSRLIVEEFQKLSGLGRPGE